MTWRKQPAPSSGDASAQEVARARYERDELLAISRALSSERDTGKLLELILSKSRQMTGADAGSVYIVESQSPEVQGTGGASTSRAWRGRTAALQRRTGMQASLHFMLSQNDSMAVDFAQTRLPIDDQSVVGRAVLGKKAITIADVATLPAAELTTSSHNRTFDRQTGYQARSMLTVPMLSAMGDVMGVIQLINKKRSPDQKLVTPADFTAEVVPFDDQAVAVALALASQAGVSLENAILYDEIHRLFESFVAASVTAIEARDPTTSGHSRRVAMLSVALAESVDAVATGPLAEIRFSREELRQLQYAGMLHDFGKVGVREHVLVKARKLYDWQLDAIAARFRYVRKAMEADALRAELQQARGAGGDASTIEAELAARLALLDEAWRLVNTADQPSLLEAPVLARLAELATQTYLDEQGKPQPFLTADELAALQVPRGSLTPDERRQIERHVDHTRAFLRTIPWGRNLRNVPTIAGAHHELLDGSGYPLRLRGEQIPIEARMLTIADIFDALTASDRPYKAAVPVPRALGILEGEVRVGKCDAQLFQLFVAGEVYKKIAP